MKVTRHKRTLAGFLAAVMICLGAVDERGQTSSHTHTVPPKTATSQYHDPQQGMTSDEAVAYALEHNGELDAMRKEAEAGEALIRQARLRANPSLALSGTRQIGGADNSMMAQSSLPLELGGRRAARILVAEREHEIHSEGIAERERQLAAEVRFKFGECLAAVLKLRFAEETIAVATENLGLVTEQVNEGRRPPLEQSMEAV